MLIINYFDLVVFAVDCVVCRNVCRNVTQFGDLRLDLVLSN